MSTPTEQREQALSAAEGTCPRCGTPRDADQEYCIECGLQLPALDGTVPRLRRRWVRRLGWYPGDWIWVSLLTLLVAAAGTTAAILIADHRRADDNAVFRTPSTASVAVTTRPTPAGSTTADTSTLPTAPEPTTSRPRPKPKPKPTGPPNGRLVWPPGKNGYTIVLGSYPFSAGRAIPLAAASSAARAHLPEVGVLVSGRYSSLHPGYYVVFSGIYGSRSRADAALGTAHSSGFARAYTRPITK